MGVSGSGKTVVGRELAASLGFEFRDADDFHPPENVALMRAGRPLGDVEREPWLATLGGLIRTAIAAAGPGLVLACSALRRHYRDRLTGSDPRVRVVHLAGPEAVIRARLTARRGHYMPASLLDSQLATLEPPGPDERPIVVQVSGSPADIAATIRDSLEGRGP